MYITESGGRGRRIPFGADVRGLRIVELELEIDDIKDMLQMHEHELKDNLYNAMCTMVSEREGRNRSSRADNRYRDEERHRQMQMREQAKAQKTRVAWDPHPEVSGRVKNKNNGRPEPIPDFTEELKESVMFNAKKHIDKPIDGLVWTDE